MSVIGRLRQSRAARIAGGALLGLIALDVLATAATAIIAWGIVQK